MANSSMLDRLKYLFSGDMPEPKEAPDLGKKDGKNPPGLNVYGMGIWDAYKRVTEIPLKRRELYYLYEELDEVVELATILDAMSEDATQVDGMHPYPIWVQSADPKVVEELNHFYFRVLKIQEFLPSVARDIGLYGDDFAVVYGEPETGVYALGYRPPYEFEKFEDVRGVTLGYIYTPSGLDYHIEHLNIKSKEELEEHKGYLAPWDVIHFKLYQEKRRRKERKKNIYGTSMYKVARRPGRILTILEELVFLFRLTRTVERRLFKVDVGDQASPAEIVQTIQAYKRALSTGLKGDPITKAVEDLKRPHSLQDDIFWPTRKGSESSVEVVSGNPNIQDLSDVELFINEIFGAMRAPKEAFGFEDGRVSSKSVSQQDLRFSRSSGRLQGATIGGYITAGEIHLAYRGWKPEDIRNGLFNLSMVPPSFLEQINRMELASEAVRLASDLLDVAERYELNPDVWKVWVLDNMLAKSLGIDSDTMKALLATDGEKDEAIKHMRKQFSPAVDIRTSTTDDGDVKNIDEDKYTEDLRNAVDGPSIERIERAENAVDSHYRSLVQAIETIHKLTISDN